MIKKLLLVTFVLCAPLFVGAQATDEFTIRVFGALDTEAPSTTTIQSIASVGSSQIDLQWASSTDNYVIFGYVVSRDGVPIATTTDTFFSDTSLSASTTYTYTVSAFDGVPNYAASSLPASTTTLAIPVVPEEESSISTAARVVLDTLSVKPDVSSARLEVETRRPARIEFRIGESDSYEIGYLVGSRFSSSHNIPIGDLRPNTKYYYEVYGYTPFGAQSFLGRGSFETLSDLPPPPPANVSQFSAEIFDREVLLGWTFPLGVPEGARVRVVRNHFGYPSFLNDGIVVYEGSGSSAVDVGALGRYSVAFYTAFVIDVNGLTSSGAIARVSTQPLQPQDLQPEGIPSQPSFTQDNDSADVSEGRLPVTEIMDSGMPDFSSIEVRQLEEIYTFASSSIPLMSAENFTVSIDSEEIVGDFKTIVATLQDPRGSGKTFSFLLRLNADGSAFQATIAPVFVPGESELMVEIYDYDALVVARYMTTIQFVETNKSSSSTLEVLFFQLETLVWAAMAVIPFAVLWFLWFIFRRRSQEG